MRRAVVRILTFFSNWDNSLPFLLGIALFLTPISMMGLIMLAVLAFAGLPIAILEIKHNGWGEKWITYPMLTIWFFAFAHMVAWYDRLSVLGFFLIPWFYILYLLARHYSDKLILAFPAASAIGSVSIIIERMAGSADENVGIFSLHHSTTFVILLGIVMTPRKWLYPLCLIGLPAVLLAGSEEGIFAAGILIVVMIIRQDWHKKLAIPVIIGIIVIIIIFSIGAFGTIFPRLDVNRFDGPDSLSHSRAIAYEELITEHNWILGEGYYWNLLGSDPPMGWQTVHNVPLRIASQWGIIAGLTWLAILIAGLIKTKYKYLFILLLCSAVVDHMLWTTQMPFLWMILGVITIYSKKSNYLWRSEDAHSQG